MNKHLYNNIGVASAAIMSTLKHCEKLSLPKVFLIMPFVAHQEILSYLGRKTTRIQSIEKLIAEKINCFSNFNKRYYDNLCLTINTLQLLEDIEYVEIGEGCIELRKHMEYHSDMGERVAKIFKASGNMATLLRGEGSTLYLNLRIEL